MGLKGLSDIYKDSSIALQCKGFALVYLPVATDDQSWIKMNAGQTGFYRVNYDANNWRKLADQLNTDHKVTNISCPRYLTHSLPNVAKGKFPPNFESSFSRILTNK